MAVRTVAWNDEVRAAVESAFGPPGHSTAAQARRSWRTDTDGEFWSRCVVLSDDAEPVAVAAAFHPRLHAEREWVSVGVAPARRRSGWGSRAFVALGTTLPANAQPLRAKVAADSPAAAIAERWGFRPIQRSRQVRVEIPGSVTGVPAQQFRADDPAAVAAWRDWYVAGHDWDPPQPQPDEFWADMAAETRLILGTPQPAGDSGLSGIAHVYVSDGQTWFVGGALDRDAPTAGSIAAGLLIAAQRLVGEPLHVELDDWMSDVTAVIEELPHAVLDEVLIAVASRVSREPS